MRRVPFAGENVLLSMDINDLYENIFDMAGVAQHPAYHGFSYGMLVVENGHPVACFYLDDKNDQKLQYILSHGMIEIYSFGSNRTEIYYGYVTDGDRFFCEELVYPRQDQREGGIL